MFAYKDVQIGDFILVRRFTGDTSEAPGIVFRVKDKSVDALVIQPYGFEHRFDLLHESDADKDQPFLKDAQFASRGIFRLVGSTSARAVAALADRLAALEGKVGALAAEVKALAKKS